MAAWRNEGGVARACVLYADLVGHREKRDRRAPEHSDLLARDHGLLGELARQYGCEEVLVALRQSDGWPKPDAASATGGLDDLDGLDDYSECRMSHFDVPDVLPEATSCSDEPRHGSA